MTNCHHALAKLFGQVLGRYGVAEFNPVLVQAEAADPYMGSLGIPASPLGPGGQCGRHLGDQVAPAIGEQGVSSSNIVEIGEGVDVGAANLAVPRAQLRRRRCFGVSVDSVPDRWTLCLGLVSC